jgi:PTH1 family peptidyl-tRNA hydrolase
MSEQERWMIVGLGNPGRKYAKNRHNVGFQCLERLAQGHALAFEKQQSSGLLALGVVQGRSVILLKPQAFMNESGKSVASISRFYRVPLDRVLVIYDELDLPIGSLRLRPKGGSGGHKGMRSIIEQLASQDFARLRVGIGRPPGRMDPADYVLQNFDADELPVIDTVRDAARRAAECWLTEGVDNAMNLFNKDVIEQDV